MNRPIAAVLALSISAAASAPAIADQRVFASQRSAPVMRQAYSPQIAAPRQTYPAAPSQNFAPHPEAPRPMFANRPVAPVAYQTAPVMRQDQRYEHIDRNAWNQRFAHDNRQVYQQAPQQQQQSSGGSRGSFWTGAIVGAAATSIAWGAFALSRNSAPPPQQQTVYVGNSPEPQYVQQQSAPIVVEETPVEAAPIIVQEVPPEIGYVDPPQYVPVPVAAPITAPPSYPIGNAPADEYYGRFGMSILGIKNSVKHVHDTCVNPTPEYAHQMLHDLIITEEAFRDLQHKHPGDSWILQLGYGLVEDYQALDAALPYDNPHGAAIHGIGLGDWLDAAYPGNQYALK